MVGSKVDATSGDVTETKLFYYQQSDVSSTSSSTSAEKYRWDQLTNTFSDVSLYPGSQPLALDVNGDQAMDLLYQSASDGLKVALGSRTATETYTPTSFFSTFALSNEDNADCETPNTEDIISLPNSNAFVDLNGDCVPDLLLTRQTAGSLKDSSQTVNTYYQIYQQVFVGGQSRYCLAAQDGKLVGPSDVRSTQDFKSSPMPFIEISDFNRDGMLDMAFVSETGVLNILLNSLEAPGPKSTNLCNDVGNTAQLSKGNIFPVYPFSAGQLGVIQEAVETKSGEQDMKIVYDGLAASLP